ncbi:hypothetical protein BGP_6177 [Beggiatoa sp. PS]|nr:hypothetical protein BGP_6177 [Beggiatoa sp. PS]
MANKIENRAAAWRLNPSKSAVVIVMPERDVPGIRAKAWESPINKISCQVRVYSSRSRFPITSAHQSNKPNTIVAVAIINGDLK